MRVLVISDDPAFGAALAEQALRAGHEPVGPATAARTMEAVAQYRPAVLVVDAPGPETVRSLLQRAREAAESTLPVIAVVPGHLWRAAAHPVPLDQGLLGVVGRAEALSGALKRLLGFAAESLSGAGPLVAGALRYDPATRVVSSGEATVRLTRSEGALLAAVLRTPGQVVVAGAFALALWGSDAIDPYRRASLRTHAYTLRRKLAQIGAASPLVTRAGAGLMWQAE